MVFLWLPIFFCVLLPCLLPWVHLAEEEKKMSISVDLSLPEVLRLLLLLSHKFFNQEAEANHREQLNPDVVNLKTEIMANWSQPRLQKVLLQ